MVSAHTKSPPAWYDAPCPIQYVAADSTRTENGERVRRIAVILMKLVNLGARAAAGAAAIMTHLRAGAGSAATMRTMSVPTRELL